MPIPEIHIPREATIVVAASNSKTPSADYVCSGANDHVEIQAAVDALPATGGCIFLLDGTYALGAQVARAIDDVKFIGCGQATLLNLDGGTAVITAGGQDGWLFAHFATDAGGPAIGGATQSAIRSVWIAGVRTDDPATAYTDGQAVSAVEAAGLALASGKNINVTSILTTDDNWSGLTAIFTAGEVLALGDLVYLKAADSRVWKADADDPGTMPTIAMATCATTAGNPFEFLLLGFMRHDAWDWTPGSLLYASIAAGTMSHTAPVAAGDQVQTVGIAITADIILFNPNYVLVELV